MSTADPKAQDMEETSDMNGAGTDTVETAVATNEAKEEERPTDKDEDEVEVERPETTGKLNVEDSGDLQSSLTASIESSASKKPISTELPSPEEVEERFNGGWSKFWIAYWGFWMSAFVLLVCYRLFLHSQRTKASNARKARRLEMSGSRRGRDSASFSDLRKRRRSSTSSGDPCPRYERPPSYRTTDV